MSHVRLSTETIHYLLYHGSVLHKNFYIERIHGITLSPLQAFYCHVMLSLPNLTIIVKIISYIITLYNITSYILCIRGELNPFLMIKEIAYGNSIHTCVMQITIDNKNHICMTCKFEKTI